VICLPPSIQSGLLAGLSRIAMKRTILAAILLALHCALVPLVAQDTPSFTRTEDVIYGRKFGTALTLDVLQPAKPNGASVIFMVSGGWFSSHESINPGLVKPFLDRGYTVFAVVHGSQPKFIVTEITQDIHRAVRFIRHNAAHYNVDPNKFGIAGARSRLSRASFHPRTS
jgi:acetyl esterase/lipase